MEMETETPSSLTADLITALEQATLIAKQLPNPIAADRSHIQQIHAAHRRLTLFLYPPPPQPPAPPRSQPENSVSSAVGGGGSDEPMEAVDDDGEDEQDSRYVETVEGRLRACSIQNKRLKRQLSPSPAADWRRSVGDVAVMGGAPAAGFDPVGTKLRSLDLIYQFHA
ncbi:hypothetical protein STAS_35286 [Striga asiatica]|uniref:Uncharacterized protein n=1 Tax=Striga asiatica TaxID=4170 RepID=A0A5A7RK09_STRAF|nr:hypothetical protein STAS_35286 [Striga asiatica]